MSTAVTITWRATVLVVRVTGLLLLILLLGPLLLIPYAAGVGRHRRRPAPRQTPSWGPSDPRWRAAYLDPIALPAHPARRALRHRGY